MNKVISFLICWVAFAPTFAQNYVELAKFYYSNTALNSFEQSDSSTRVRELGLDITVPLLINASDAILTGLIYERIETKLFEDDPAETFSVAGLRVGLSKKHSQKWTGTYMLVPKLASDFKHITWKDFQLGAIALLKYTKHENMNFKLGLYFNTELSGPFIAPLLGLYYLSESKKIEANLLLPFLADVNYKILDRLYLGANFTGMVRSYHLAELPTSEKAGYVVKASNEFSSYLKFNLTNALSIQARIGYSLGRSYRVYDDDDKITFGTVLIRVGDDRQQLNTDFSNGFIYQATLGYRFIKKEK